MAACLSRGHRKTIRPPVGARAWRLTMARVASWCSAKRALHCSTRQGGFALRNERRWNRQPPAWAEHHELRINDSLPCAEVVSDNILADRLSNLGPGAEGRLDLPDEIRGVRADGPQLEHGKLEFAGDTDDAVVSNGAIKRFGARGTSLRSWFPDRETHPGRRPARSATWAAAGRPLSGRTTYPATSARESALPTNRDRIKRWRLCASIGSVRPISSSRSA